MNNETCHLAGSAALTVCRWHNMLWNIIPWFKDGKSRIETILLQFLIMSFCLGNLAAPWNFAYLFSTYQTGYKIWVLQTGYYKVKSITRNHISLPQTLFPSVARKNKDAGRTLILGAMAHTGSDEWVCHLPTKSWLGVDYWVEGQPLDCLSPGKGSQFREMRAWGGYTLASMSPMSSTSQSHGLGYLPAGSWRRRTWKLVWHVRTKHPTVFRCCLSLKHQQ